MMYRYAGSPRQMAKPTASLMQLPSAPMQQMQYTWAVANGIVNGSNGKLSPQNNATRAEVAAILMRFCEMSK